jgi:hypothetical protein
MLVNTYYNVIKCSAQMFRVMWGCTSFKGSAEEKSLNCVPNELGLLCK